jgi:hypothetical protein
MKRKGYTSSEQRVKERYGVEYLDEIETLSGHILSVLVEELGKKRINLSKLIGEINSCYYTSKIQDVETRMREFSGEYDAIVGYIHKQKKISWERKRKICNRINDEINGITPEDRIFEKLPDSMRLY